jgi:hypothetical protein
MVTERSPPIIERTCEMLGTRIANRQVKAMKVVVKAQFLKCQMWLNLRFLAVVWLFEYECKEKVSARHSVNWQCCEQHKCN